MKLSLLIYVAAVLAGYAPYQIDCPGGSLVREANGLSEAESSWISQRHQVTNQYLETFLEGANLENFNAAEFLGSTTNGRSLSIGVAFSGGGYRAMLCGAGQLSALDERTVGAQEEGLGGLLQASTYLVGLSGGNWLVGSVVNNDFVSVQDIVDNNIDIWDLQHSIVNVGGWNVFKTLGYYRSLYDDVEDKKDAGFDITITDTWGRALSHQFFPESTNYGQDILWSQIQDLDSFSNYQMPFPIVVADGRTPGTQIISGNSTIFEFSPFEMGSWDPSLYAFTQTKYLGTEVDNGIPVNGQCIGGFDNAGYVMGTSSTLFNQFVLQINTTSLSSAIKSIITYILRDVSQKEKDIAEYNPNPFQDSNEANVQSIVQNDTLFLVDGGEDLQNIPLYPLLQPAREVDVVFAYDNSADTESWPNGASMVASYERQFLPQGNGTIFPHVPDQNTFINLGLTGKPTFFGCDAKNLTSLLPDGADQSDVYKSPLIVYTANRQFSYASNTSTFKLSYNDDEKLSMISNGFEVASRLNSTLDENWKTCVSCAIIRREQERQGIEQSDQCKQCFAEYCWDGSIDSSPPDQNPAISKRSNTSRDTAAKTSGGFSLVESVGENHNILQLLCLGLFSVAALTYSTF